MLWTRVDLQFLDHLIRQLVLREHSADGVIDQIFGLSVATIGVAFESQTGVAGVPRVVPSIHFSARHRDFLSVDDDHEITTVGVGSVLRTVLTHQDDRDITGQSTQYFVGSVNDEPLLFDLARLGDECWLSNHGYDLYFAFSGGRGAKNRGIYRALACSARPFGEECRYFDPAFLRK